jgi:hypothetical protein
MDIARDLIVAAVAAGGAWAAVKAELRMVWKFLDALERRIERLESQLRG